MQVDGLVHENIQLILNDMSGKLVRNQQINQGSTLWYVDVRALYEGNYVLKVISGESSFTQNVPVIR